MAPYQAFASNEESHLIAWGRYHRSFSELQISISIADFNLNTEFDSLNNPLIVPLRPAQI
jgi:hypothetical protein